MLAKNGLTIVFNFSKPGGQTSDTTIVTSTTTNSTPTPIVDFQLQAAVPKVRRSPLVGLDSFSSRGRSADPLPEQYITLTLGSPSSTAVPPHSAGVVTQQITLQNTLHGQVRTSPQSERGLQAMS